MGSHQNDTQRLIIAFRHLPTVSEIFVYLSKVQTAFEFANTILNGISDVANWVMQLPETIDYWYTHQGGKYLIKAVNSLFFTVAA